LAFPAPGVSQSPSTYSSPAKAAPDPLNPNPNPLLSPTKPSEVEIEGTYPITLEQTVELALRHNPQLQIKQLALEKSQAALREAKAALYPSLSVQSGFTRQETFALSDQSSRSNSISSSSSLSDTLSGEMDLSYDIYTSGERSATIRAAIQQVRNDRLEVKRLIEQTRLDVANDYYDLQNADEQVRINRSAVINAQQSLQDTQAQERAGLGTRFDVLQSQVQFANAVQNLTSALSQQRIAQRQLVQLLNLSQTVDISAADPVEAAETWPITLEESVVFAYKNRVELEQYLAQREIAVQNRRAAIAALGPTISLSGTYGLSNDFDNSFNASTDYSVGATVKWTAFDGGAARARADQFDKDKQTAEANFADTRNTIRFDVEQAYFNLRSNFENIQTTTLAIQQARESLRLARLRFQAGVGTQTDVINSENSLTEAEGNQVTAIVDYNKSLASLKRNVGNISDR
jgi:OMF family outer membrane factor